MPKIKDGMSRRAFLTGAATVAAGAVMPNGVSAEVKSAQSSLQVWSCGGLAEAFMPANSRFKEKAGIEAGADVRLKPFPGSESFFDVLDELAMVGAPPAGFEELLRDLATRAREPQAWLVMPEVEIR